MDESPDYIHTEGVITFKPKETTKSVLVEICDDAEYEEDEDFYLELWDLEEIPCRDPKYKVPMLKERVLFKQQLNAGSVTLKGSIMPPPPPSQLSGLISFTAPSRTCLFFT